MARKRVALTLAVAATATAAALSFVWLARHRALAAQHAVFAVPHGQTAVTAAVVAVLDIFFCFSSQVCPSSCTLDCRSAN